MLVGLLAATFAVAAVGGLSTMEGVQTWYPSLDKPPWTPPNGAFGPIWTFLYATMAVAGWEAVRRDWSGAWPVLGLFSLQLALNALWSPLFFAWHRTLAALIVMSLLWLVIAVCIGVFFRISRVAAALFLPYLAWVSVAWSLNAWIWWFNR
jgi:tryptophan-rich sensory protein